MVGATIRTPRLVLRPWTDADESVFFALNSDPQIMEWIGAPRTPQESERLLRRFRAHHDERGFSPWCVQLDGAAIGWAGLSTPAFRDEIEIGWRLLPDYWSHGYATEAARAALADGFTRRGVVEVISFTAAINLRSQAVMERIGLRRVPSGDFAHPSLAADHRLSQHMMYHLTASEYLASSPAEP